MIRRLAPFAVAAIVLLGSVLALSPHRVTTVPERTVPSVIVVGVPGLRWDDVSAGSMPTLYGLAGRGSVASMAVRSAQRRTCPVDGWLTLGAGNLARFTDRSPDESCQISRGVTVADPAEAPAIPDMEQVVNRNARLLYGARPGALAETARCVTGVGIGGAIAAARPSSRIERYQPDLPADVASLFAPCAQDRRTVTIIDLGGVSDPDRDSAARRVDGDLARVVAARPAGSLLIVAGVSDTGSPPHLHVALAEGPGFTGGWLTSSSTGRDGYVQLTDIAPTVLAALGLPRPVWMAGRPMAAVPGRAGGTHAALDSLADADRAAQAVRRIEPTFVDILVLAHLLFYVLAIPVLRRARRWPGAGSAAYAQPTARPPPLPRWLRRTLQAAAAAAALVLPAALVANIVPWWRTPAPGLVFAVCTLAVLIPVTVLAVRGPWYRGSFRPLAAVAALAAALVAADVLTGSRLQLNAVAGYSALDGSRFAGLGSIGFGVFAAGLLISSGCLAQRVGRAWRPVVIAALGAAGVVAVGSPYLGADAGGAIALTTGVCVAAVISTGGWLTFTRLLWAAVAGLVVAGGFALVDLQRPVPDQGHLGRFLTELANGTAGIALRRIGEANVVTLAQSRFTLLTIGAGLFIWFVLLRPSGGLKRVFGLYPAVRAGLIGATVVAVVGGFVDGAGVVVAGAAAATAVPLAVLTSLRVLVRADDRSIPEPDPESTEVREKAPLDS